MINTKSRIFGGRVFYSVLIFFSMILSVFVVSTVNPGAASAATGCGVNTGTYHDYAGLIVNSRYEVKYVDQNGNTTKPSKWGQSNNTKVKVTTDGATTTPPGGVINLSTGQHFAEKTFDQVNSGCNVAGQFGDSQTTVDSVYAVLGTGGSSPESSSGSTNWALDCDYSKRKDRPELNPFQLFRVTGVGTPSGVPSNAVGGGWDARPSISMPNGFTTYVTITYTATVVEPKDGPLPPAGTPTCSQFQRVMTPNSRYHFSYFAQGYGNSPTNSGPPMTSPRSTLPADGRWNNYTGGIGYQDRETNVATEGSEVLHKYNFPAPPDENWRGWRVIIEKWQKQSDDKWHFDSTYADINCPTWVLTPSSWTSAPYVEQGGSVSFGHAITNSGNAVAVGVSRCVVLGGACADGHSNTLPVGVYNIPDNPYGTQGTDASTPLGSQICQQYSVSRSSFLNSNARTSDPACATVVGGKTAISTTSSTGNVEPTETKQMTIQLSTTGFQGHPAWGGYTAACSYVLTGASVAQSGTCSAQVNADGGSPPVTVNYTASNADIGREICLVATLTIANANFYANPAARVTQSCFRVITRPYIQAVAGDVSVGCQANNASVLSWNRNGGAGFAGAGGSYAVYAYNRILGFAAGQTVQNIEGYGSAPANLAFGNAETSAIGSGAYGNGTYGGGYVDNCTPDYYATKPGTTAPWPGILALSSDTAGLAADRNYYHNSSLSIDNPGTIRIATNARLYVNGDVYIGGNITPQSGTVESMAHVPNFTIIAKGNIYIGANVTSLYGGYLAGNQIVTCANSNFTPKMIATGSTYNECRTPLTVTGSLAAKKIHFLRTNGSLLANQPAEVVRYNPLASFLQATSSNTEHKAVYDSITTLPPVL